MSDDVPQGDVLRLWQSQVSQHTPARIFRERSGLAYKTGTWLELRRDHAWAVDAVNSELDLVAAFSARGLETGGLFEVRTRAATRQEFLLRPDWGRRFSDDAREEIGRRCPVGCDLQVVIGDGLSSAAVAAQVPDLLPRIMALAQAHGWRVGQAFVIRNCRVGILNDVGELLAPRVVVLLIGERPGLATAESLSAYLAYQPRAGHTDADRNLISNIHARGVAPSEAASRVMALAGQMRQVGYGGVRVKESSLVAPTIS